MTDDPYARELKVALDAVHHAAKLCRNVQGQLDGGTLEKGDRSPVTVADFGSQALVCRALEAAFPGDPVVGEEDADVLRGDANPEVLERILREVGEVLGETPSPAEVCGWIDRGNATGESRRFWTLDPIDGTKGFLRGEHYSIALALIEDGEVVLGVVGSPNLPVEPGRLTPDVAGQQGVLFYAIKGRGTRAVPLDAPSAKAEELRVSEQRDLGQARLCESFEKGHTSQSASSRVAQRLGITAPPRRLDSLVKYGLVARGDAELYMRLPKGEGYVEKIWDHAAGVLLVTESGGAVTDAEGKPLDFGRGHLLEANRGVVASNGQWHERALEAVRAELTETEEARA